jgi:hypothetical protein
LVSAQLELELALVLVLEQYHAVVLHDALVGRGKEQ